MTHPGEVIETTTLGNGLRVVSERLVGSRSTSLGVWVTVGSRDEASAQSGASHFLEHLLFKGTDVRSARDVAEAIDEVGGDMNAFTAREHTAFYSRVPATARSMATELLFDVVADPSLRPYDVDAEREVIGEELIAARTTPDDLVFMALYEELYADHRLGAEVLGDESTIDAMTAADIATFHNEWYRPANLVVAAAGDVDHDELVELASKSFDSLPTGAQPNRTPPGTIRSTTIQTELPVEQLHVAMAWRGLPNGHPDRYAYAIANQVLGGSPSSRLFQSIREDQALAYTVYSSTSGYSDAGSALVYGATSAARGPALISGLQREIDTLVANGVTARELESAKTGFEGAIVLGLEDSGARMNRIANGIAMRNFVVPIEQFLSELAAVTVDDVNRVIAEIYGGPSVISLVGPQTALDACR